MSESSPTIEITDLKVRRAGEEVLHSLTLGVPRGQVVGLLGPSGCGKSTLMRAIVGVQRIHSGRITVLGHPAGDAALRSRVAYMTQSLSVYEDLTVRQNLDYFRKVLRLDVDEIERVIGRVDLAQQSKTLVGSLSGGQQSRVSLAAALLGNPELLVLDEPTVGLDPVLRRDLWKLFTDLAVAGVTVLISSHVMEEATRCDRLLLLRGGALLADETPASLLERTGAADSEAAFLQLIDEAEAQA